MRNFTIGGVVMAVAIIFAGCAPNQRILNSSAERTNETPSEPKPATKENNFEQDIESMRTADFIFIYVFRRKDGSVLDSDDKRYAGQIIPLEMNRRTVSDSGRAIIIGSNFRMPQENLKVLSERFAFEDFSGNNAVAPQPKR